MREQQKIHRRISISCQALLALAIVCPPLAAHSSLRNLAPEGVTDEAAVLRGELTTSSGEETTAFAYLGTRDGKNRPEDWEFHIALGNRRSGILLSSVEGLKPATTYFYTFQTLTGEAQAWAGEAMKFTTQPAPPMADNRRWIRNLDPRDIPARGFITARPAARWEDSLLSGNGKMGALVMGRPLDEKIILAHEKVYLPLHKPLPPIDQASLLPEIRRLLKAGKYQDAVDLVFAQSWKEGYGPDPRNDAFRAELPVGRMVIRWTDPFVPAMDLQVHMGAKGELQNYLRSVDFSTGVATTRWEDRGGTYRRRLFVSRPDNLVVLLIEGPDSGKLDCELELARRPVEKTSDYWSGQTKFAYGIKQIETGAEREWLTYRSSFTGTDGGYQGAARVIVQKGTAEALGDQLVVKNADRVLVLMRIEPVEDYARSSIAPLQKELSAFPADFETLLARHARVHGEIFNRVALDLNGGADRRLPTEDLIAQSTVEKTNPALLEKVFDAGRYMILSSSGDWPPNLQGKWNGTWGPPWSGDYTQNGDVQSAMSCSLNGNMPETLMSLFGYMDFLMPDMRENARRLFGARGIHLPSRASTHGLNNHFDETWPMTFWTGGAAWYARFYYDYYLYTGDREFLSTRALPFMKEAALFYEDFLVEGEDGKYVFIPSYSPENNPGNSRSQAGINATMDIAVAKELLTNLIQTCETLNVDPEGVARWKRMLSRMPDYMINAEGAVKEYAWPTLEDNYQHRHNSHLYPLWFGDLSGDPRLSKAFHRAIELRLQERVRQGGGWMPFGMTQMGQAATALHDADTAYLLTRWIVNGYYFTGLAPSIEPGPRIFNLDIAGSLPDVMIRMLVQSQPGTIDLLPALPEQWTSGQIQGVLTRSRVAVKSLRWNAREIRVVLNSAVEQTITLTAPQAIASIQPAGRQAAISELGSPTRRQVRLPASEDLELVIRMQ